jgi:hypothetical protein
MGHNCRSSANHVFAQEWKNQLRSSLHPLLFGCVYHAAAIVAVISNSSTVTRTALLLAAPRVAQAVFAACVDYYTWSLAQQLYGTESKCAQISVRECESLLPSTLTLARMRFTARVGCTEPVELVLLYAYIIKLPRDYVDVRRALLLALAMGGRTQG